MATFNPSDRQHLDQLLFPRSHYYGPFSPEQLMFNANLQDFSQRVSLITGLQTGGKLSAQEACEQIESLYHQLKHSQETLLKPGAND